ncbi:DUF488 domain-containing protein [Pseudomonas sp. MT3]|uniref:DUF488 domain-containing protein n=1 Tax=Pseudomonas sp. ATCC 13867 TaxID=1294143 RepID=UPI0002C4E14B|nr:DUF488 domain-containing protein [Pseudomonas sp. ATCC 13867]AGI23354.1 hypothetical protein H681_07390 [Pseudomonas sp. ATCC 13867]RFQ40827.1 DUF488 domain-containing protein [Pseudomonas sp. ATCC 13867]
MIRCKRAYEPAAPEDGQRVLVDRLWPRGIRKEDLQMELWAKEVSPSNELRQRFHHDPGLFEEFRTAYHRELNAHPEYWMGLLDLARKGNLTLLYAAKDEDHNNAQVLAEFLEDELEKQGEGSSPVCYAGKTE